MNDVSRIPPRKKDDKPITGEIFYPTTEEGKALLYNGSAMVMLDILERKLGSDRLNELMKLYEVKQKQKS